MRSKFTPENGRVWLRAEKKDNNFVLIVGDTGVGIAEKSLPFVFDRFWQEDSSSKRKFQGVGIGLALVKELTETMGGQVTVESQLGKGTTFTVRLPYEKAEMPQLAAGNSADAASLRADPFGRMARQFVPARGIFPHGGLTQEFGHDRVHAAHSSPSGAGGGRRAGYAAFSVSQLEEIMKWSRPRTAMKRRKKPRPSARRDSA